MPAFSAGLLLYRRGRAATLEVLIVHPGGPFWARRDEGAWSIPKGEHEPDEDPLTTARREFAEELGSAAPPGTLGDAVLDLGEVRLKSGKRVHGFAVEGDLDADRIVSNTFELEWPPRSGRTIEVPEVDRAAWVSVTEAERLLNPAQRAFVERLVGRVGSGPGAGSGAG